MISEKRPAGWAALAAACIGFLSACASAPEVLTEAQANASSPLMARMEAAIADGKYPETTSVIVMRGGEVVYEHYFGDGSAEKLNDTRSATKTVAAFAVGIARQRGEVKSLDEPVWPFLETQAPDGSGDELTRMVTMRDLLTMTSAFDCNDNDVNSPGNEEQMYPTSSWTQFTLSVPGDATWSRADDGLGPWRYCTAGVFLLGQALEEMTGTHVDDYVREQIFRPLGIGEAQWDSSPSGEIQTGGGLELTSRDLARLGSLITSHGRWQGQQIVPESWIGEMTTKYRHPREDTGYGYLIWEHAYPSPCGPVETWYMAGNGGNHIVAVPARDAVIVVTREAYNTRNMHQQTMDLIERYALASLPCE